MFLKRSVRIRCFMSAATVFLWISAANAESGVSKENIYPVGKLKARDSTPILKAGDEAPDFTLPSVLGEEVTLSQYQGKKNVVISFVPAAWTPVCTMQWPVYNLTQDIFDRNDAILLGITVDNIPTLYAWTNEMAGKGRRFWFSVLSDFFPHGQVAKKYGVLRTDGVSERALFLIDKKGIIRYIDVHDINQRPSLRALAKALEEVNR
jgi:peroxiredoxin (alkyl hydroperoxide reductase subunit C)